MNLEIELNLELAYVRNIFWGRGEFFINCEKLRFSQIVHFVIFYELAPLGFFTKTNLRIRTKYVKTNPHEK